MRKPVCRWCGKDAEGTAVKYKTFKVTYQWWSLTEEAWKDAEEIVPGCESEYEAAMVAGWLLPDDNDGVRNVKVVEE